jgi:hypothetical protein
MYLDLQSKLCALRVAFGRKRSAGFSTHSPTNESEAQQMNTTADEVDSLSDPTRTSTHEALNGGVLAGTSLNICRTCCSQRRPDTRANTRLPDHWRVRPTVPRRPGLPAAVLAEHARMRVQVRPRLGDLAAGNRIALVHL